VANQEKVDYRCAALTMLLPSKCEPFINGTLIGVCDASSHPWWYRYAFKFRAHINHALKEVG